MTYLVSTKEAHTQWSEADNSGQIPAACRAQCPLTPVVASCAPSSGDAAFVAREVGATGAVAFDLTAACSGFLFGINTASQFLHNGAYKTAVVIGADALSRWVDWSDRNVCVLFGDGAGAAVLKATDEGEPCGVLGYEMHSNGAGRTRAPNTHAHTHI